MPRFTPPLCANQLRYLAEKADGWRDTPLSLVVTDGRIDVIPTKDISRETQLFTLDTPSRGPGIDGSAKARIFWHGDVYGGPDTDLEKADAVFLTQSAVEKFLLPYYMRFKSGAAVQGLENTLFNHDSVAAVFHIPPSIPKLFPGQLSSNANGFAVADMEDPDISTIGVVGKPHGDHGDGVCDSLGGWCAAVDESTEGGITPQRLPADMVTS
jgi:hypothetical protein